ncbi:MAG: phosphogluconate dehydrogenase (NAD(+)-dependent, decarboxylating) [Anaerolineae bacterium]
MTTQGVTPMRLAMVGLGKMGGAMARRLRAGGHEVVAFNRSPEPVAELVAAGADGADSLSQVVERLDSPRAVWIMIPAGAPTEATVAALADMMDPGDVVVDGGNSNYHDTMRRGDDLAARGLKLVDVGTSGGVWGLAEGYSMMVGGDDDAVAFLRPALETLAPAPDLGWGHVGPRGAGHFVKMVHNGIEYGLMEAYAEGFQIMKDKEDFSLDVHKVAEIWRFGSVVRSWLLDLVATALEDDPDLSDIRGWVADSDEGRWTVDEAVDLAVPAPVIAAALFARFASRREDAYANKLLAAMRQQFGGHAVKSESG